jgi:hypothetical protein
MYTIHHPEPHHHHHTLYPIFQSKLPPHAHHAHQFNTIVYGVEPVTLLA